MREESSFHPPSPPRGRLLGLVRGCGLEIVTPLLLGVLMESTDLLTDTNRRPQFTEGKASGKEREENAVHKRRKNRDAHITTTRIKEREKKRNIHQYKRKCHAERGNNMMERKTTFHHTLLLIHQSLEHEKTGLKA